LFVEDAIFFIDQIDTSNAGFTIGTIFAEHECIGFIAILTMNAVMKSFGFEAFVTM
jgi:hypothetical protein